MSALPCLEMVTPKTNQFIRPKIPFNVVSTAKRLAPRGHGFAASPNFAEAISYCLVDAFANLLMAALSHAKGMSTEEKCALFDLNTGADNAQKVSPQWLVLEGKRLLVHQS